MISLQRRLLVAVASCLPATAMLPSAAPALTDYSAGKTPEQLFNTDCLGCHPSARGLGHGRNAHALTGYLREHYTTNARSAARLASYLIRARASNSTVRTTGNWFLKIVWAIWREVSTGWRWLIGARGGPTRDSAPDGARVTDSAGWGRTIKHIHFAGVLVGDAGRWNLCRARRHRGFMG